jgi:hypothetical protein
LNVDTYRCGNCGCTGAEASFAEAKDLYRLLDPGGTYTDRECGRCGALAYPVRTRRARTHPRRRYIVVHHHRHGCDVLQVSCRDNLMARLDDATRLRVAEQAGLDYNPSFGEWLDVVPAPERCVRIVL